MLIVFSAPCDQGFAAKGCWWFGEKPVPRFSYNQEQGECQPFPFFGCGGNENKFETLAECWETCQGGIID